MSSAWVKGLFAALLLPLPVQSHHSIMALYDPENIRPIEGTLESVKWANPHTIWTFSVQDDQGEVETWSAEGGAVNTLARNGLTRDLFEIGARITVIGPMARSGQPRMVAAQVIVGGTQYGIFPALLNELDEELPALSQLTLTSAAGYDVAYSPAPDLFRVWTPVDFPAIALRPVDLPLTEAARTSLEAYDPVSGDLADQCIPAGMPSMLDQPYPIEFIDEGDRILMRLEEWNGRRTIHMTDANPNEGSATTYGHSSGLWDGDTLVISTSDIDYPYFSDSGIPLTGEAVVTERYSISADGRRMDWTMETVDPNVFTAPAVLSGWAVWAPAIDIQNFDCE